MNRKKRKNGFTVLEMMVVLLIVAVLVMITLPNIQQKEKIIRSKGCEALIEVVNSQIMLYEIETNETPANISQLISKGYLKSSQTACPDGSSVYIADGQAEHD